MTHGPRVTQGQRVLVVDGLAETEEVLKAVFEPRGLEVNRVRAHQPGPPTAPNLVVVHEDNAHQGPYQHANVPRVVIGSAELPEPSAGSRLPGEHYLREPFHYRELIQAIETLLAQNERAA